MLTPRDLHFYQKDAVLFGLQHPDCALWLQMGLGKTACALTILVDRMRAGQVQRCFVFGPLRVIQSVWAREAQKWEHTRHLRFNVAHGTPQERKRALLTDADVYLINYENLNWLSEFLKKQYTDNGLPLPYQMAIYDEVACLKDSTGVRVAGGNRDITDRRTGEIITVKKIGWRKFIDSFQYRVGLTGTPASNGYLDLHGQFLAIDGGQRLGTHKTPFRDNYFSQGYNGWGYTVTDVGKKLIEEKISDITLKMDAAEYLPHMPKCSVVDIPVDLPPKAMKVYKNMEVHMFAELDSGSLEVFTKGSAAIKCLQIANGAVYTNDADEQQVWEAVHEAKLDALASILNEAGGQPVLVGYTFKSDAARIMKRFKRLRPVNMTDTPASQTERVIDKWARGDIRLMIGHPASMGHGIDGLQESCHQAVWFGPTYNKGHYDQFNARINRQGQKHPVTILRLLARATVDLAVVAALEAKATDEAGLKAAMQAYRDGRLDVNKLAVGHGEVSFV